MDDHKWPFPGIAKSQVKVSQIWKGFSQSIKISQVEFATDRLEAAIRKENSKTSSYLAILQLLLRIVSQKSTQCPQKARVALLKKIL